jgi:hypothetical protein
VAYEIQFVDSAKRQLELLPVAERTGIVAAIEKQLTHEPLVKTRNRKELRPNVLAPWGTPRGENASVLRQRPICEGYDPGDWRAKGQQVVH